MKLRVWPFLLALVLCSSCGIKTDLSMLTFQPEGTGLDIASDTATDQTVPDVSQEGTSPDDATDTIYPDVSSELYCFDVLRCLFQEEQCFDFSTESCMNRCSDDLPFQGDKETFLLWKCLSEECSSAGSGALECAWNRCPEVLVGCMIEKPGDDSCADVVACQRGDCPDVPGLADRLDCMADCAEEASSTAVPAITDVYVACGASSEDSTPGECLESFAKCYNGSGQKTCSEIMDCALACECIPEAPLCDQKTNCILDCYYGVSDGDNIPLAQGVVNCTLVEAPENPFACLANEIFCVYGYSGADSCTQVMAKLNLVYYGGTVTPTSPYLAMVDIVRRYTQDENQKVKEAIQCLSLAAQVYPGMGAIPVNQWNTCAAECN